MIRGWTAVIVFTTLAVVMMIGVNVRMWRRMKAATAAAKADAVALESEAVQGSQESRPPISLSEGGCGLSHIKRSSPAKAGAQLPPA